MLLIIPAIDLRGGVSAFAIEGSGVGTDPVAIARLLRVENAKTLHVTDLDGASQGRFTQFGVMEELFRSVDIPIEASGGISTDDEAARLLELGACRVVLRPGLLLDRPADAAAILAKHGAGKIVAAIEHRTPAPGEADDESAPGHPLALGAVAKAMGFRRLLYTGFDPAGRARVLDAPLLARLAGATGLRVTVSGGVTTLEELRAVEVLEKSGVDSVVLRRAIYGNRFSCQAIWRLAEAGDYPFTAKV
jgi:phosphoribosylformimino-5-aminoimidazole carboxamide ribotide isomerase